MASGCESCGQDNRDGSKYCMRCGAQLEPTPGADPLVGSVIHDRFRVMGVLGEGGMGRVYLAEQQMGTASRNVALKVLHAAHSRDATLRKRFYRECEVVIHLSHPNTIQFYDFGELPDGRLFIVMEYIEGHSLAELLREGPLNMARVERLVAQIAGSLHEAHESGVVHRDLKPDNILLTVRGGEADFVKVCDFGIAKRDDGGVDASQLTLQGTVIGTPQYMSPEQLTGGTVDARSDVYSLGLIAYEMLAGRRPFEASSPLEWAARHTTSEPPPLDRWESSRDLPEETRRAVLHALAKLPGDRPQTARAFAAELLGREDATTPVTMTGSSQPPPRAPEPGGKIDQTAPTMLASPVAMRLSNAPSDGSEVLRPAGVRSIAGPVAGLVLALLLLGAGFVFRAQIATLLGVSASSAIEDAGVAVAERDAGSDAGPAQPREWIRIVRQQRLVTDAARALGPPDGQYAVLAPASTLTLELLAGTRIESDGGSGPDLFIEVDEARSGPYRADVAVAVNTYTTLGSDLVGSLPLDIDQLELTRPVRYVRLKNRSARNVYVDAIGVYRTTTAED
jgi:serine/threonine-protein kinase